MGFWRSRWKPETVSCRHSVRTLRQLFGSGESRAVRGSCDGEKADVYGENGEIEFAAEYQEEIPFLRQFWENRRRLWL